VSEVRAHLVSQHWPMAVPMQLPVPVPSRDLLVLLSSYEVYVSHENDLIILILSAPAYIANPVIYIHPQKRIPVIGFLISRWQ